ncbi:MAG: CHAP domain-containing protein [Gemmatimonadales bacterium]
MSLPLTKGDFGPEVAELQRLLVGRGFPVAEDRDFGNTTYRAVRAFQAQNLDQHGQPLVVDGRVGPLSWWSLTHPKPDIETPAAVDFMRMPPGTAGGSAIGRAALAAAIGELEAGAGEIGGNNAGPFVRKYLQVVDVAEGNSWCAAFVSWCYLQGCGGQVGRMPFPCCPGARGLLSEFREKGWAHAPTDRYEPAPGDPVFWWRVNLNGWQGHVGLVHQVRDGMLYTIEGNRSPRVQGFSYVFSRMEKLLGYGHAEDG